MKKRVIIVGSIAIVVFGSMSIGTMNNLNVQKQSVEQQQGQIATVLQRRGDLIPNLVNSVKGAQSQESKVYGKIAEARTQYYNAKKSYDKADTPDEKTEALQQQQAAMNIMVGSIQENYPDLKSNDQITTLMAQIEGSENRVSVERQKYNNEVKTYNQMVVKFPSSIVANMTGNHTLKYFENDATTDKAPKVDFGE